MTLKHKRTLTKSRLGMPPTFGALPIEFGALDTLVGYPVRRAQARIFADFHATCADINLNPAQFSVLLLIRLNPRRKPSEFAEALGIQRPNFAAMIETLQRRGLTARDPSSTDRRSHMLTLTAAGEALLDKSMDRVTAHNTRMTQRLSASELKMFLRLLDKLGR